MRRQACERGYEGTTGQMNTLGMNFVSDCDIGIIRVRRTVWGAISGAIMRACKKTPVR
jgi:hypothetical protein